MIFVDTSAWFAVIASTDPNHEAASLWFEQNCEPLLTTDYVADETLTLLKVRRYEEAGLVFGRTLFEGETAMLHFLSEEEVRNAWRVFVDFRDKRWSFTDVTSKIIMEELGIRQAFAFDRHFVQFGNIEILPNR